MSAEQVGLHKLTGRLPVGTEKHRDAVVEMIDSALPSTAFGGHRHDNGKKQDVNDRGLHDRRTRHGSPRVSASSFRNRSRLVDHGGNEIIQGLPLHRDTKLSRPATE